MIPPREGPSPASEGGATDAEAPAEPQESFGASVVRRLTTPSGITFLVIASFVLVGAYNRLVALGTGSVWVDEAQSTLYAVSILQHGYPVIQSQHLINNWEPLYPYVEALSILVLGKTNFAFRLPSAILGVALIPVAYAIGSRVRDRYVGIALAAMVAFSTEYIAWSREARWYMLFVFLMAVGLLLALLWSRRPAGKPRRWYLVGLGGTTVALSLTSPGLFLVYLPAFLAGLLAYATVVRWKSVRRFFRGPDGEVASATAPPRIPYRYRIWLVLAIALLIGVAGLVEFPVISAWALRAFGDLIGFPTYQPTWSTNLGTYLEQYYPALVVLSFLSVPFIAWRRRPVEIGLLVCAGAAFAMVSVGASITSDLAGGQPSLPRHLEPLLFLMFLLSSISLVGTVRLGVRAVGRGWPRSTPLRRLGPALFGVAIVGMLVVPSAVVPTSNTIYTFPQESPADSLVTWVPFSLDPTYPSALYQTLQVNYQLASDYVLAHRSPGDVVGATSTGPVSVYIGTVQYWIRGNANPTTIIYPNGIPEFYQTGARLIANTSQLEGLFYNSSGWLVTDDPGAAGAPFPGGMDLAVRYFMTAVPAGEDETIGLYHWNRSTPSDLVRSLISESRSVNSTVRNESLANQLGWAVTAGVTNANGDRLVLIPIVPYLLPLITNSTTVALGTLFNVYNHRPDLLNEFPEVLGTPSNTTALLRWACEVASGTLSDPTHTTLAPYSSVYCD